MKKKKISYTTFTFIFDDVGFCSNSLILFELKATRFQKKIVGGDERKCARKLLIIDVFEKKNECENSWYSKYSFFTRAKEKKNLLLIRFFFLCWICLLLKCDLLTILHAQQNLFTRRKRTKCTLISIFWKKKKMLFCWQFGRFYGFLESEENSIFFWIFLFYKENRNDFFTLIDLVWYLKNLSAGLIEFY